jgi:hypothetical protein
MHHSLRFYDRHRPRFIKAYLWLAGWTRVPILGAVVRFVANGYGKSGHGGFILTLSEAEQIVDAAKSVALGPCSCRKVFHKCDTQLMSEIVIGHDPEPYSHEDREFRSLSKEEAKTLLRRFHAQHLTHGIMRCGDHYYAICNCCSCCCVPTRLRVNYGVGQALVRNKGVVADFVKKQL